MSNICIFCGRSTKDAEVTYTQGDKPMCIAKFGLAVDRRGRDRSADFPNMIAFGKIGEFCEKYVKKGDQLFVEGRIKSRTWETDRGEKRYATDIVVDKIELLSKPSAPQSQSAPAPAPQPRVQSVPLPQAGAPEDGDLPF